MTAERLLTPAEANERLGITSDRRLQVLAKEGRIVKRRFPTKDGNPHPEILYTADSVAAEAARKEAGPIAATAAIAPISMARMQTSWMLPPPESVPKLTDVAEFAYVTLAEAAELLRMPASWVKREVDAGRINYTTTLRGGIRIKVADLKTATRAPKR